MLRGEIGWSLPHYQDNSRVREALHPHHSVWWPESDDDWWCLLPFQLTRCPFATTEESNRDKVDGVERSSKSEISRARAS